MKKASPEARHRKREASHEEVWFGLALTWEEVGQPRGGLVWFGAYLGRGRPATRRSGLVWHLSGQRVASHEEVWVGLALTLDSQWWRHT
jgi:hypothetical protein